MVRLTIIALVLPLAACGPPTVPVLAAEGGSVTSEDGLFTIFFPPGALSSDSDVSIETIGEDDWGVGAPGRFERVGAVYRVRPEGLLASDAFAILELASVPDILQSAEGDDVMPVHYVYDGDKVRPAPATRTHYLADGRAVVVARILDLGLHWTGERIPGPERALIELSARLDAEAGPHDDGVEWRWSDGSLRADEPISLLSREVRVSAASGPGAPSVLPIEDGGVVRSWDATWDEDIGLHVWEVLGLHTGARTETLVSFEDRTPFTVEPALPLAPVLDPLPGWTCAGASADAATLFAGVDVVSGASDGSMTIGAVREVGQASCR